MRRKSEIILALIVCVAFFCVCASNAQLTIINTNVPAGFGQAGFIQAATLDPKTGGGTLTMNGITMIVPANSVIQFPANTLQWADLFNPSVYSPVYDTSGVPVEPNLSITAGTTGLALLDNPAQTKGLSPYLPFNANVLGNIDTKGSLGFGADTYVVGLILPIDQDLGNGGAGPITFIDYSKGRFEVGGQLNTPGTGTVVEINDPLGRYGWAHSPDPRWSVDADNPTITAGDGYPMCIPRFDPAKKLDIDCPSFNRPLNPSGANQDPFLQAGAPLQVIVMPPSSKAGSTKPDPWKPAPFMIGDFVAYAGVTYKNDPNAPLHPAIPLNQQTYISANTVGADKVAIYTAPCPAGKENCVKDVGPAYMSLERMVIGTGSSGLVVLPNATLGIAGGATPGNDPRNNITVTGFVSDSTELVDIFAADINPVSGKETHRLLGTVLPEAGILGNPPRGNKGRFRFDVGKGNFLPTTRVYVAQSHHGIVKVPNQHGNIKPPQGGLISGQYHAPMFTFEYPDAPPGFPIVPSNFDTQPFLFLGEGGNPSAGPLTPFPPVCPPVAKVPTCQP